MAKSNAGKRSVRGRTQSFASVFKIRASSLRRIGSFNPILGMDSRLFVDPLLLAGSKHSEFSTLAAQAFNNHFAALHRLLSASKKQGDLPWREASKMFAYPEIKHTSLGYGRGTNRGSGMGEKLRDSLITTAKEIVDLGVNDPAILPLLGLLEDGVGADRISDMTTNVILEAIIRFTERVCVSLKIPTRNVRIRAVTGNLPINPADGEPILLVASDVLRDLPVANDWDDVASVANHNVDLRDRVNAHIGHLFAKSDALELPRSDGQFSYAA